MNLHTHGHFPRKMQPMNRFSCVCFELAIPLGALVKLQVFKTSILAT